MLYSDYSSIHIVDKGRDSADFGILKACSAGDIVVTSDGGLAAMALAKNCAVISPSGIEYTNDNISLFLNRRYMRRKSAKNPGKHRSYSVKLPDCKNLSKHVSYKIMLKNTICRLDEKN